MPVVTSLWSGSTYSAPRSIRRLILVGAASLIFAVRGGFAIKLTNVDKKQAWRGLQYKTIRVPAAISRNICFLEGNMYGIKDSNNLVATVLLSEVNEGPNIRQKCSRRIITKARNLTNKEAKELRKRHNISDTAPIMWRVLLHSDHIHTFQYATQCLVKVLGTKTRAQAFEIVVEAHRQGRATIETVWKSKAQHYCLGLQRLGLIASLAPDEEFMNTNDE